MSIKIEKKHARRASSLIFMAKMYWKNIEAELLR